MSTEVMKKLELVTAISEKSELSKKDSEKALKAFEEVITETLASGRPVQMVGFGTFDVTDRAARVGRNPKTGEELQIPAMKTPKFKAGKPLKDALK